jgi:hypothetical protein
VHVLAHLQPGHHLRAQAVKISQVLSLHARDLESQANESEANASGEHGTETLTTHGYQIKRDKLF